MSGVFTLCTITLVELNTLVIEIVMLEQFAPDAQVEVVVVVVRTFVRVVVTWKLGTKRVAARNMGESKLAE